jgi:hypothetical protein
MSYLKFLIFGIVDIKNLINFWNTFFISLETFYGDIKNSIYETTNYFSIRTRRPR